MSKTIIDVGEYAHIIDLYNSGLSQARLEEMYGVSHGVIKRILVKEGVALRDHSHKMRKYSVNEKYFDSIDTPNKAYILGLLYADGCNAVRTRSIKISLQERDSQILLDIRDELQSTHPIAIRRLNEINDHYQNAYELTIVNKHMSERLESLGMVSAKSLVLTFPTWMRTELIPHFIRGYFDGDGYVSGTRPVIEISGTKEFCFALAEIGHELDIKANVRQLKSKSCQTWCFYICNLMGVVTFMDYIYRDAELYIERKHNEFLRLRDKYSLSA